MTECVTNELHELGYDSKQVWSSSKRVFGEVDELPHLGIIETRLLLTKRE